MEQMLQHATQVLHRRQNGEIKTITKREMAAYITKTSFSRMVFAKKRLFAVEQCSCATRKVKPSLQIVQLWQHICKGKFANCQIQFEDPIQFPIFGTYSRMYLMCDIQLVGVYILRGKKKRQRKLDLASHMKYATGTRQKCISSSRQPQHVGTTGGLTQPNFDLSDQQISVTTCPFILPHCCQWIY